MKKVLIVQTGSIDYVPDDYYERYKLEGLVLVPEDPEDIPIAAAPLEEVAKEVPMEEVPKVILDTPKVSTEELKVQTKGLKLPRAKRLTKV